MGDYQPLRPDVSGVYRPAYAPPLQLQEPPRIVVESKRPFPILAIVLGLGAVLFILSIIGVFLVKNKKKTLKNEQKAIKSSKFLTKGNKLKDGKDDKATKAKQEKDDKDQKAKQQKDEKTEKAKGAKEEKSGKVSDAKDTKNDKNPKTPGSGKSDKIDKNQPTIKSFNLKGS